MLVIKGMRDLAVAVADGMVAVLDGEKSTVFRVVIGFSAQRCVKGRERGGQKREGFRPMTMRKNFDR
jgi:hypothetical protein